ncbi:unnamed protein product [Amoebophrya sp. A120]|nr:unnamed protein product [Amoebophrya sp. A120]|eukprot:GSA120T00019416001.1
MWGPDIYNLVLARLLYQEQHRMKVVGSSDATAASSASSSPAVESRSRGVFTRRVTTAAPLQTAATAVAPCAKQFRVLLLHDTARRSCCCEARIEGAAKRKEPPNVKTTTPALEKSRAKTRWKQRWKQGGGTSSRLETCVHLCRKNLLFRAAPAICCLLWNYINFFFLLSFAKIESKNNTPVEKKVTVKETVFDSPIDRMEWCGDDNEVVLILTRRGRLHRSSDGGVRWDDITAQLGDANDNSFDSFLVSPADKRYLVAVGTSKSHFVSSDAGRSWRKLKQKATIHTFVFHPTKGQWALLSSWTDSCNDSAAEKRTSAGSKAEKALSGRGGSQQPCVHNLFVTKDLGVTFTLVSSYVVQFAWGEVESAASTSTSQPQGGTSASSPQQLPPSGKENLIYFSHFNQKSGNQPKLLAWSLGVDFCVTEDFGRNYQTLVPAGNKFGIFTGYIFVAKLDNAATQNVALMVSTDDGKSFGRAKIGEQLEEKSYTILDTSEGAVVLHVHHGHIGDTDVGHVYISDAKGLRYTKSLSANVRSNDGTCDFDKVGGIDGIYMANQVDTDELYGNDNAEDLREDVADAEEEIANKNIAGGAGPSAMKKGKSESRVRTVISFDKGGTWSVIAPPEFDSLGQRVDACDQLRIQQSSTSSPQSCSLHLHGTTSALMGTNFAPFYSMPSAAGIILGTGNVGPYLRYEDANTFISIDGGLTWIEAHKKPYIYEIGDHGGLIVMAPSTKKTREVIFSWNEGTSWFEFEMAKSRIEVDNIVTAPNSVTTSFLVHGARGTSGVVYHMDFAALGMPTCVNPFGAGTVASDYYKWSPSDNGGAAATAATTQQSQNNPKKCLLGKQVIITRRKPTSECFNGEKFERPVFQKNCECSQVNFQCEMGFQRAVMKNSYGGGGQGGYNPAGGPQVAECLLEDPELAAPDDCESGRVITLDAYRKTPGDTCEGGWKPAPVQMTCPSGKSWLSFTTLFQLFLFCTVLYCAYHYLPPEFVFFLTDKCHTVFQVLQVIRHGNQHKFGGITTFNDVKYGNIQLDQLPESAAESVGTRWDYEGTIDDDFLADPTGNSPMEDAPTLMHFDAPKVTEDILNGAEPVRISRGLTSAATSVPRLDAPLGMSSAGGGAGGASLQPGSFGAVTASTAISAGLNSSSGFNANDEDIFKSGSSSLGGTFDDLL